MARPNDGPEEAGPLLASDADGAGLSRQERQVGQSCRAVLRLAATLLVVAVFASVAALACYATVPRGAPSHAGPAAWTPGKLDEVLLVEAQTSKCGKIEEDVEYVVEGGWYMSLDHVPDPEMCCAMCQGVEKCKSFSWVKDAGLDGCKSQCWLKGGLPNRSSVKPGVVSGLPPPRPALEAPASRREDAALEGQHSMFCFSLVVPHSYEEDLIRYQREQRISVFGCDAWDIYSNVSLQIAPDVTTTLVNTSLEVQYGGDSYSALNSWIFIAVWKRVIEDKRHEQHPWVVKVDPDAVFFPERLRPVIAQSDGVGFINNCKYGFHGPLEVLSSHALTVLEADYKASFDGKSPEKCVQGLHFGQWGEDFFLSQCLHKIHHVSRSLQPILMCEAHCDCDRWYWCDDPTRVSFHPFKRVDMYEQCMANSLAAGASWRQR